MSDLHTARRTDLSSSNDWCGVVWSVCGAVWLSLSHRSLIATLYYTLSLYTVRQMHLQGLPATRPHTAHRSHRVQVQRSVLLTMIFAPVRPAIDGRLYGARHSYLIAMCLWISCVRLRIYGWGVKGIDTSARALTKNQSRECVQKCPQVLGMHYRQFQWHFTGDTVDFISRLGAIRARVASKIVT